jgi:hypothetical protein
MRAEPAVQAACPDFSTPSVWVKSAVEDQPVVLEVPPAERADARKSLSDADRLRPGSPTPLRYAWDRERPNRLMPWYRYPCWLSCLLGSQSVRGPITPNHACW